MCLPRAFEVVVCQVDDVADAFEAEQLGEEERLRRAPSVVNRRINS